LRVSFTKTLGFFERFQADTLADVRGTGTAPRSMPRLSKPVMVTIGALCLANAPAHAASYSFSTLPNPPGTPSADYIEAGDINDKCRFVIQTLSPNVRYDDVEPRHRESGGTTLGGRERASEVMKNVIKFYRIDCSLRSPRRYIVDVFIFFPTGASLALSLPT